MAQMDAALGATGADPPRKRRLLVPLLIGLGLMAGLGGSAFFVTYSGLLFGGAPTAQEPHPAALPEIAYVALDPMVIPLGSGGQRHLRFAAQIEVPLAHKKEVETLRPRLMDVLNSYLRALDLRQLEDPTALTRIRAQILRRLQVVTGEGRVQDLLIIEFVMN